MTATDAGQPQRFFFLHIRKTAGTALRQRLINHFGEAAVYPTRGLDGTDPVLMMLSVDHARQRLAARGDQIKVVMGHFPFCAVERIGGPFTILTLLRDPVERTLSSLRDDRERNPAIQDRSLEEIYDAAGSFRELANNHMTKVLSFTTAEMAQTAKLLSLTRAEVAVPHAPSVELDREHLERAKQRIAEIDAVGLQEHFEDFCDELSGRFGWQLGEPERVNTTTPVEVPDSFRTRIAEDNPFDIELYEFAKGVLRDTGRHPESAETVGVDR